MKTHYTNTAPDSKMIGDTNCYNKCLKCGHCDTSYEENHYLHCNCVCLSFALSPWRPIHTQREVSSRQPQNEYLV